MACTKIITVDAIHNCDHPTVYCGCATQNCDYPSHTQLKILGGAPEDYRGERWATGDYSGRLGEEAHSSICPLIPPDKILTGDLWWELLRGPQWGKTNSGPRKIFIQGAAEEITPLNLPQRCIYLHINPFDLIRLDIVE